MISSRYSYMCIITRNQITLYLNNFNIRIIIPLEN